eukprot:scaffold12234_cov112-Isochrysis_galbana.AAC.1
MGGSVVDHLTVQGLGLRMGGSVVDQLTGKEDGWPREWVWVAYRACSPKVSDGACCGQTQNRQRGRHGYSSDSQWDAHENSRGSPTPS